MSMTNLNMVAFTWTPNASGTPPSVVDLARLKTISIAPQNTQVNAKGIAARHSLMLNVKQEQTVDFTVMLKKAAGEPLMTNLDITLWDIGTSTHYLGSLRSGSIDCTTLTDEGSGIASGYKNPVAVGSNYEITTEKLIVADSTWASALINGVVTDWDVVASITFGGVAFSAPMTIKSAKHTVDRDKVQMEEVTLTPKGAPTGPSDNSLLGNILLGTSQVSLAIDTGAGQYNTASAQWALITKLTTRFADANVIEQTGQFVFQGPAAYVAD